MRSTSDHNYRKTEARVMSSIKKNWQSDVSYIEGPNYGGRCLVDSSGLIVAWVQSYERADPEEELCIDIRHLLGVMPLVLATGRPLVIVVAYPDEVRYVVWRPGTRDFGRYETPYEEGWQAIFLPRELSPVGPGLPREITTNPVVRPRTRKSTPTVRWRGVLEDLADVK